MWEEEQPTNLVLLLQSYIPDLYSYIFIYRLNGNTLGDQGVEALFKFVPEMNNLQLLKYAKLQCMHIVNSSSLNFVGFVLPHSIPPFYHSTTLDVDVYDFF